MTERSLWLCPKCGARLVSRPTSIPGYAGKPSPESRAPTFALRANGGQAEPRRY